MTPTAWNLILLGYRNDVARARVLAHLRGVPASAEGPRLPGADSDLPARIFTGLPELRARDLQRELENLGAQTALAPAAATGDRTEPAPAAPAATARPSLPLVLLALAVLAFIWYGRTPLPPVTELPVRSAAPVRTGVDAIVPEFLPGVDATVADRRGDRANTEAVQLAETGRYAEAADKLSEALRDRPDDVVLQRNLQTALLNWGIRHLNAGQVEEAQRILQEAAALGERSDVLRALGVAYLRTAEHGAAREALEAALELDATQPNAMLALAQVYVEEGRRADALDLLHRAREAGARGAELDRMIKRLSREVDAEWDFVEMQSPHFRVSFADAEDPDSVDLVLDALENAYESVGARFDLYPDGRTAVVLYAKQDFHTATGTPDWAGAAFDGRIKLAVGGLHADDAGLDRMVRHEYAHSLIARLSKGRCPAWLNEGLAVWAEETHEGERLPWARQVLAGRDPLPFARLGRPLAGLPPDDVPVAYAQSYFVVRELVDRYGDHDLPELLDRIGGGEPLAEAFLALYPEALGALHERVLWQLQGAG